MSTLQSGEVSESSWSILLRAHEQSILNMAMVPSYCAV
jgi:hypothetical protein